MVKKPARIFAAVVLLSANLTFAQEVQIISNVPIGCVPGRCRGARIEATVRSTAPVTRVRVLFHSDVDPRDYFLEMQQMSGASDQYFAELPVVAENTKSVTYFIAAVDANGKTYATDPTTAPVTRDCQVADRTGVARDQQNQYAKSLVIGMTDGNQPADPMGFRCFGIVSQITVAGDMKPNEACRAKRRIDPCAAVIAPALLVAGGAAAAVAVAIIDKDNPKPGRPISPARP
ncbi:MAG TPA: hypothetical protein VHL58_11320 [Thermoanaerobaculia bacterium]|nr:hypothetical protein [Thermoanaerobaculia bacterium]